MHCYHHLQIRYLVAYIHFNLFSDFEVTFVFIPSYRSCHRLPLCKLAYYSTRCFFSLSQFLQDTFDALFAILMEDASRYGEMVSNAVVRKFSFLVALIVPLLNFAAYNTKTRRWLEWYWKNAFFLVQRIFLSFLSIATYTEYPLNMHLRNAWFCLSFLF